LGAIIVIYGLTLFHFSLVTVGDGASQVDWPRGLVSAKSGPEYGLEVDSNNSLERRSGVVY